MVLAPLVTDRIAARAVDEAAVADLVDQGNLFRDLDGVRWRQVLKDVAICRARRPSPIDLGRAVGDLGGKFLAGRPQVRKVDGRPNLDPARAPSDCGGHQERVRNIAAQRNPSGPYRIPSHLVRTDDLVEGGGVALLLRLARLRGAKGQQTNVQTTSSSPGPVGATLAVAHLAFQQGAG